MEVRLAYIIITLNLEMPFLIFLNSESVFNKYTRTVNYVGRKTVRGTYI